MAATEAQKRWQQANRDKVNVAHARWRLNNPNYSRQYYLANIDKARERSKKSYEANKERHLQECRNRATLKTYGLTLDEYQQKKNDQHGKCAICPATTKLLNLDHDHKTGKVRDFLCGNCNRALGLVGDDISTLQNMIAYLVLHGS